MTGRPRILYVWDADYPWDVRTEKICRSLVLAGFPVAIAARNRARRPAREDLPEGTVYRLPAVDWLPTALDDLTSLPAFLNPRWIGHLANTARDFRPDVVIVRDLPLCPTAIWEARRLGLPVILDMAENYPAMIADIWKAGRQHALDFLVRNPRAVRKVEQYCLNRVDGVLAVVEESKHRIVGLGYDPARVTIVSNTPPASRAMVARPVPRPGRLTVVYLGMMELTRGVGELIAAAGQLRATVPGLAIQLIGDGRDRHLLEEQTRALGLQDGTVEFLGFVPNREALAIVGAADIGVVPHHADESWDTTIPNKLFDYMAAGLAVVTSDAAPAARIVRETGAGTVFRSGDAADCARAIADLSTPASRVHAGAAGQRAVVTDYNWEADTERMVEAITSVAAVRG